MDVKKYTSNSEFDLETRVQLTNEVPLENSYEQLHSQLKNDTWKWLIGTQEIEWDIPFNEKNLKDDQINPQKIINGNKINNYCNGFIQKSYIENNKVKKGRTDYHSIYLDGTLTVEHDLFLHEIYRYLECLYPDHPDWLKLLTKVETYDMINNAAAMVDYKPNNEFFKILADSLPCNNKEEEEFKVTLRNLTDNAFRRKFYGSLIGYRALGNGVFDEVNVFPVNEILPITPNYYFVYLKDLMPSAKDDIKIILKDGFTSSYAEGKSNIEVIHNENKSLTVTVGQDTWTLANFKLTKGNESVDVRTEKIEDCSVDAFDPVYKTVFRQSDWLNNSRQILKNEKFNLSVFRVPCYNYNVFEYIGPNLNSYNNDNFYLNSGKNNFSFYNLKNSDKIKTVGPISSFFSGESKFISFLSSSQNKDKLVYKNTYDANKIKKDIKVLYNPLIKGTLNIPIMETLSFYKNTYNKNYNYIENGPENKYHLNEKIYFNPKSTSTEYTISGNSLGKIKFNFLEEIYVGNTTIDNLKKEETVKLDNSDISLVGDIKYSIVKKELNNYITSGTFYICAISDETKALLIDENGNSNINCSDIINILYDNIERKAVITEISLGNISVKPSNSEDSPIRDKDGQLSSKIEDQDLKYLFTSDFEIEMFNDANFELSMIVNVEKSSTDLFSNKIQFINKDAREKYTSLNVGDLVIGEGIEFNTVIKELSNYTAILSKNISKVGNIEIKVKSNVTNSPKDNYILDYKKILDLNNNFNKEPFFSKGFNGSLKERNNPTKANLNGNLDSFDILNKKTFYEEVVPSLYSFKLKEPSSQYLRPSLVNKTNKIFEDIKIDKILNYKNKKYLMNVNWLDYLKGNESLSEEVNVGSNLIMQSDFSGYYSNSSENKYTDKTLELKFQTLNWNEKTIPRYVQIGDGGENFSAIFKAGADIPYTNVYGKVLFDDKNNDNTKFYKRNYYQDPDKFLIYQRNPFENSTSIDSPLFEIPLNEYNIHKAAPDENGNTYDIVDITFHEENFNNILQSPFPTAEEADKDYLNINNSKDFNQNESSFINLKESNAKICGIIGPSPFEKIGSIYKEYINDPDWNGKKIINKGTSIYQLIAEYVREKEEKNLESNYFYFVGVIGNFDNNIIIKNNSISSKEEFIPSIHVTDFDIYCVKTTETNKIDPELVKLIPKDDYIVDKLSALANKQLSMEGIDFNDKRRILLFLGHPEVDIYKENGSGQYTLIDEKGYLNSASSYYKKTSNEIFLPRKVINKGSYDIKTILDPQFIGEGSIWGPIHTEGQEDWVDSNENKSPKKFNISQSKIEYDEKEDAFITYANEWNEGKFDDELHKCKLKFEESKYFKNTKHLIGKVETEDSLDKGSKQIFNKFSTVDFNTRDLKISDKVLSIKQINIRNTNNSLSPKVFSSASTLKGELYGFKVNTDNTLNALISVKRNSFSQASQEDLEINNFLNRITQGKYDNNNIIKDSDTENEKTEINGKYLSGSFKENIYNTSNVQDLEDFKYFKNTLIFEGKVDFKDSSKIILTENSEKVLSKISIGDVLQDFSTLDFLGNSTQQKETNLSAPISKIYKYNNTYVCSSGKDIFKGTDLSNLTNVNISTTKDIKSLFYSKKYNNFIYSDEENLIKLLDSTTEPIPNYKNAFETKNYEFFIKQDNSIDFYNKKNKITKSFSIKNENYSLKFLKGMSSEDLYKYLDNDINTYKNWIDSIDISNSYISEYNNTVGDSNKITESHLTLIKNIVKGIDIKNKEDMLSLISFYNNSQVLDGVTWENYKTCPSITKISLNTGLPLDINKNLKEKENYKLDIEVSDDAIFIRKNSGDFLINFDEVYYRYANLLFSDIKGGLSELDLNSKKIIDIKESGKNILVYFGKSLITFFEKEELETSDETFEIELRMSKLPIGSYHSVPKAGDEYITKNLVISTETNIPFPVNSNTEEEQFSNIISDLFISNNDNIYLGGYSLSLNEIKEKLGLQSSSDISLMGGIDSLISQWTKEEGHCPFIMYSTDYGQTFSIIEKKEDGKFSPFYKDSTNFEIDSFVELPEGILALVNKVSSSGKTREKVSQIILNKITTSESTQIYSGESYIPKGKVTLSKSYDKDEVLKINFSSNKGESLSKGQNTSKVYFDEISGKQIKGSNNSISILGIDNNNLILDDAIYNDNSLGIQRILFSFKTSLPIKNQADFLNKSLLMDYISEAEGSSLKVPETVETKQIEFADRAYLPKYLNSSLKSYPTIEEDSNSKKFYNWTGDVAEVYEDKYYCDENGFLIKYVNNAYISKTLYDNIIENNTQFKKVGIPKYSVSDIIENTSLMKDFEDITANTTSLYSYNNKNKTLELKTDLTLDNVKGSLLVLSENKEAFFNLFNDIYEVDEEDYENYSEDASLLFNKNLGYLPVNKQIFTDITFNIPYLIWNNGRGPEKFDLELEKDETSGKYNPKLTGEGKYATGIFFPKEGYGGYLGYEGEIYEPAVTEGPKKEENAPWTRDEVAFKADELKNANNESVYLYDKFGKSLNVISKSPKFSSLKELIENFGQNIYIEGKIKSSINFNKIEDSKIYIDIIKKDETQEESLDTKVLELNILTDSYQELSIKEIMVDQSKNFSTVPNSELEYAHELSQDELKKFTPDRIWYNTNGYKETPFEKIIDNKNYVANENNFDLFYNKDYLNGNGKFIYLCNEHGQFEKASLNEKRILDSIKIEDENELTVVNDQRIISKEPIFKSTKDYFKDLYYDEDFQTNPFWQVIRVWPEYEDKEWTQKIGLFEYKNILGEQKLVNVEDEFKYVSLNGIKVMEGIKENLIFKDKDSLELLTGILRLRLSEGNTKTWKKEEKTIKMLKGIKIDYKKLSETIPESTSSEGQGNTSPRIKSSVLSKYSVCTSRDFSKKLQEDSSIVNIKELGIFDQNHRLIGYAQFPTIQYRSDSQHVTFTCVVYNGIIR